MKKHKQFGFGHLLFILLSVVVAVVIVFAGALVYRKHKQDVINSSLPDISYFQTHKSDRFLVNMDVVQGGNPYKGLRAATPHTGGHVVFGDDYKSWPQGGTAPQNYPAIYAVADGVVASVENSTPVDANDKYHINLAIAKNYTFEYSIEPFVKEPSPGFYKQFIKVSAGQHVKKGQIIAYMYLPNHDTNGTHIHFDLRHNGQFSAPAIFTKQVVQDFHDRWGGYGYDGGSPNNRGPSIPACMGWKLTGAENPFGTGALDCLD